jgi:subtilase family serine protease
MKNLRARFTLAAALGSLLLCAMPALAGERQTLRGQVPRAVTDLKLQANGRLPAGTTLQLAIGLPLRNQEGLNNFLKVVGGTELTTSSGGAYSSETVFNDNVNGYFFFSGGGISPNYPIPWWQKGISKSVNGGSTTMRNMPDVALVAENVSAYYDETTKLPAGYGGTSVAAPLWAGFMALANQEAAELSLPSIGFANPVLYAIGKGPNYASCFHDITVGNNENLLSPNAFTACAGDDLCTGWGTPNGQNLIDALCTTPSGLVWVKFGNSSPGDGSWANPYNTLARGVAGVASNGQILIKGPGSSSETMSITKPMTIGAVGGSATVGN